MISVIIPVKNGGTGLQDCLRALAGQRVPGHEVELVVVDSGSTDGSVEVARAYGARVHQIAPEDFDHGATRNLGVELSRGEVLVFTTQDAHATGPGVLAHLVAPLDDPRVAGSYGRQVPHPGAHPPEQFFLEFLYGPTPRRQRAASPEELSMHTTLFSNVLSAMRRERFDRTGFVEDIIMSEDQEWAVRVLLAGWELAYTPEASVRHSHPYTLRQAFRRFFDSGVSAERTYLAGERPADAVLRQEAVRYAQEEVAWLVRTGNAHWVPYAAVYEGTKFAGLQLGARHRALPPAVARRLSGTEGYWERAPATPRPARRPTRFVRAAPAPSGRAREPLPGVASLPASGR